MTSSGLDNLSAYEQALQHHRDGRPDDAQCFYLQALKQSPADPRLHHDLGVLYFQRADHRNALACFEKAAQFNPGMAEAFYNKANVLVKLKRHQEALAAYGRAIDIRPDYYDAHYNLACLSKELGSCKQAEEHFLLALALKPDCCETLNALGVLYLDLGMHDKAAACFEKAIGVNPGHVQSRYNLCLVFKRKGAVDQALPMIRSLVKRQPGFHEAVALLVSLLQQACAFEELARAEAVLDKITQIQLGRGQRTSETPFLSFTRKNNPEHTYHIAKAWSRHARQVCPGPAFSDSRRPPAHGTKITIGYLSEQFRDAATSHLMASFFENHDRGRFSINAYSLGRDDHSWYRRKIAQSVDAFIDIRKNTIREAARRIHDDGVDILVDLIGWMRGHRIMILAMKPAPIQVNYLGYPATSGADFMDYIVADQTVIPLEHQRFFTENVVYLPHCYQVNDAHPPVSKMGFTRANCDLPDNAMVYCSFCTDYKIDRQIFGAWMKILAAVPGSVLWLLIRAQATAANLRVAAREAGVDPDRLIFAPPMPKDQHLERLALADLALDTVMVNGHTTTTDALWAGIPVLTLQGRHFASRVAASLLRTMELTFLIKPSLQEYVDFAVHLGLNNRELTSLKQKVKLHGRQSALFNIRDFTRGLEAGFARMWEIHLRGDPPRGFIVSNY